MQLRCKRMLHLSLSPARRATPPLPKPLCQGTRDNNIIDPSGKIVKLPAADSPRAMVEAHETEASGDCHQPWDWNLCDPS